VKFVLTTYRRYQVAWLSFRSFFFPKWLLCRVTWTDNHRTMLMTLNEVPVDFSKVEDCVLIANQSYMQKGLFCEEVAFVEFEIMSTSATFAYFDGLHGLVRGKK